MPTSIKCSKLGAPGELRGKFQRILIGLGTGIGKAMGWRNIDIRKKKNGEPFLVFSGPAQELATKRGVTSALITLSHTDHHAMACVVLET